jgi:hypothetical protein
MVGKFSYSFDRETFRGLFDTRQDALKNGITKANEQQNTPEAIFVGKRVPLDCGTTGLAEMILGTMRRKVRNEVGEAGAQPLLHVNEHQLAELDDAIDKVIRDWMAKHELAPTQSKVIAISEHPVPQPSMTRSKNGTPEVSDLGVSESSISLW